MAGAVSEIIEHMGRAARPGVSTLDAATAARLRGLTKSLIQAKPEAGAEHDRFLGIRGRTLSLPEAELAMRLAGATVLVTGGTGCIGSILLAELAARCPRRLVSVSRGIAGRPSSDPRLASVEYRHADIRDGQRLGELIGQVRPDVIFHLAAQRDPGLAEIEAHRTITTNLLGTRNVLAAAKGAGVPQVVCASTGKALRPYSPEIYTASKRAAEWLMAETAATGRLRVSAARFTHVVDNSIIYQRLRSWAAAGTAANAASAANTASTVEPIRLHSPHIAFYAQSAIESAQLLLAAFLGAAPGELRLFAINNLDIPVSLLDLALGTLAVTGSATPIYLSGYDAGYEETPFPGLYDPLTAGDVSPLLNAFEAASTTESPTIMADAFRLAFGPDLRLGRRLGVLETCLGRTDNPATLRASLSELSWQLLDAALATAPQCALERAAALAGRHWETMPPAHRQILTAIRAHVNRPAAVAA